LKPFVIWLKPALTSKQQIVLEPQCSNMLRNAVFTNGEEQSRVTSAMLARRCRKNFVHSNEQFALPRLRRSGLCLLKRVKGAVILNYRGAFPIQPNLRALQHSRCPKEIGRRHSPRPKLLQAFAATVKRCSPTLQTRLCSAQMST
jgi:hypothetical protein